MTGPQGRVDRIFSSAANDSGGKPFLLLRDGGVETYAAFFERASKLAGLFVSAGIAPGDRIAALLDNSREMAEFVVGCSIAGAIGVVINTHSTPYEIAALMQDCEPVGIVAQHKYIERFSHVAQPAQYSLKLVAGEAVDGWAEYEAALSGTVPIAINESLNSRDPALMIYSSGTTGRPKGILLSHHGLIENAQAAIQALGYELGDRSMTMLPLFSSFGFAFDFLHNAILRNSTVILEKFDEDNALDCIERFRVSFLAGVPTMFSRLFVDDKIKGRDISSLRLVDVGGGPVSPRLKTMLKKDFGISVVESYGLTEISPVASVQRNKDRFDSDSCGLPLPGFEVRVVDEKGNDLGTGQAGELLFKCDTFMLGYWNQPKLTEEVLNSGWLHTGDVGFVDGEGEIHILDRTKDMIVSNGFNVYPKEVENAIAELDGVQECAVVAIKDEIRGEVIHVFVVRKAGAQLSEEAVLNHCRERLSRYKVPRKVGFISEMPLTASGKIKRYVLRDLELNETGKAAVL